VSVSELIWNGWNLLAQTNEGIREDLKGVLGIDDDGESESYGDGHPVDASPVGPDSGTEDPQQGN
jgi:hypothetical protein